jgi:hypothetical protein
MQLSDLHEDPETPGGIKILPLAKSAVEDHKNRVGDIHCWLDPEYHELWSKYGKDKSRSYIVRMVEHVGWPKDIAIPDLSDESINEAWGSRCRGSYLGTLKEVVNLLSNP